MLKIAHLTVARQLTTGQKNQLNWEYDASFEINEACWSTHAFHNGEVTAPFVHKIPFFFQGLFLRNLYGWIVACRLSRCNDYVLMRHMVFDPFAFIFARFVPNRVSVHHAKEVEELPLIKRGWLGRVASWCERASGRCAVRNAVAILGVTREIAEYQRDKRAPSKEVFTYPNGINVSEIQLLEDKREANRLNIAFMCGTFSDWHGLDKLIDAIDDGENVGDNWRIEIHLVGKLSIQQIQQIGATETRKKVFRDHGFLDADTYRLILETCDFGLTSFALERKGLADAATLKVREMLALGLPVYSGHNDDALDVSQPFVRITPHPALSELVEFGTLCKEISRIDVRCKSKERIDKAASMRSVVNFLSQLKL